MIGASRALRRGRVLRQSASHRRRRRGDFLNCAHELEVSALGPVFARARFDGPVSIPAQVLLLLLECARHLFPKGVGFGDEGGAERRLAGVLACDTHRIPLVHPDARDFQRVLFISARRPRASGFGVSGEFPLERDSVLCSIFIPPFAFSTTGRVSWREPGEQQKHPQVSVESHLSGNSDALTLKVMHVAVGEAVTAHETCYIVP